MNTYLIPREGRTQQQYFDYVGSLPWTLNAPGFTIDPNGELVTVDGTITGFELVILPPPGISSTPISPLAFRNRFTMDEKVAIYSAAKSSVAIEVWLADLQVATEINLSHVQTIAGVQALEAYGLIGAGRAAQILGA